MGYCEHVTTTQQKAATCKTYARKVNTFWQSMYGRTLWTEYMFSELKDYLDGLSKIKHFVTKFRDGLRAPDVCVINKTLKRWNGLPIGAASNHFRSSTMPPPPRWNNALITTFCALFEFVYGEKFRTGEALTPQAAEFDPTIRLTRASYTVTQAAGHLPPNTGSHCVTENKLII